MSYLKFSPNLFLGSQELQHFKQFLDDAGFRKLLLQNTMAYGVVNTSIGGNFSNFKVAQGTNTGTIKIASGGLAIDSNGQIITLAAIDNISIINDSNWYWVKIAYQTSAAEPGVFSIDSNGNLSGTSGAALLSSLRGLPNVASRVKFLNAVLNTGEYDVNTVTNNAAANLSGTFVNESGLTLAVVGSFTPDSVPLSIDKQIFQYDACSLTLVLETVLNTPPVLVSGQEFVIARVQRNGSSLVIQDKRVLNIFKTKDAYQFTVLQDQVNPLVGVESIQYNNLKSTLTDNIVQIAWTFRSQNWTLNTSVNTVTFLGAFGGKYKSTADFNDGDLNGWRLYAKDGTYSIIQNSYKSGSQVNLVLDQLDPNKFTDATWTLVAAPDCEHIEFYFTDSTGESVEQIENSVNDFVINCPINDKFVQVKIPVYGNPTCTYNINYRYKHFNTYGALRSFPSDLTHGYLNESNVKIPYIAGSLTIQWLTLKMNPSAYSLQIGSLSGKVTGTISPTGRIPFSTSTTTLTDDPDLTWDNTAKRMSIGTGVGAVADVSIGRLKSIYPCNDNTVFHISALFYAEQKVATTQGLQGAEGYVKVSHVGGTTSLIIGTIGNIELGSVATVTSARSVQAGGDMTALGTITDWILFCGVMGNQAGGTITNGYGLFINNFPAGVTNKYNTYFADQSGVHYFKGWLTFPQVTLAPLGAGSTQNNYSVGDGTSFRISGAGIANITGMQGGIDGRVVILMNIGAFDLSLSHQGGSSAVGNRFFFSAGVAYALVAGGSIIVQYDATAGYWRDI